MLKARSFLSSSRGFSLVEMAIVLTIVGIIIGGIGILMSTASNNMKINRLSQQVITMVENVRGYVRRVDTDALDLRIADFDSLSLLPKDLGPSTTYKHAMGGDTVACAASGSKNLFCTSNASKGIAIILKSLKSDACTNVLIKLANSATDLGLTQYYVGSTKFNSMPSDLAISTVAGSTACGSGNTVNLELDFSF